MSDPTFGINEDSSPDEVVEAINRSGLLGGRVEDLVGTQLNKDIGFIAVGDAAPIKFET